MNLQRHDFDKPTKLAGDLEQQLVAWFDVALALAARKWSKALPFDLTIQSSSPQTARVAYALARMPDCPVAYKVLMADHSTTLLVFPRRIVLALVAGLLGD